MLFKMLGFPIIGLALVGCATMWDGYNLRTMVKVQHEYKFESIGSPSFEVFDNNILASYTPTIVDAGVAFKFTNKTDKPIRIVWDETVFVSPEGQSVKVFHSGVKLTDRSQSQSPTLIPPKLSVNDEILPVTNANWSSTLSQWEYKPLCGERSIMTHTLNADQCIGKDFSYYITYEIEGVKKSISIKYKLVSINKLKRS